MDEEKRTENTDPVFEKSGVSSTLPAKEVEVDESLEQQDRPIAQQREDARLAFTVIMLLIFAAQLIVGAVAIFWPFTGEAWANAQEYLRVTLPATLGVLGSAIGFYFGSQR